MRTPITEKRGFPILTITAFLALLTQAVITEGCRAKRPATEQSQPEQTSTAAEEANVAEKTDEAQKTGVVKNVSKERGEPARKRVAVVDATRCIGCGVCINACPNNAVRLVDGKAVVDPGKCKAVGNCQKVCPVGAITVR